MFFAILYGKRMQIGTRRGASAQPRGQVACTRQLCLQAEILEESYFEHTLESVA